MEKESRKTYNTPHMETYGTVQELTKGDIPAKVPGPGDGATWDNQQVHWS